MLQDLATYQIDIRVGKFQTLHFELNVAEYASPAVATSFPIDMRSIRLSRTKSGTWNDTSQTMTDERLRKETETAVSFAIDWANNEDAAIDVKMELEDQLNKLMQPHFPGASGRHDTLANGTFVFKIAAKSTLPTKRVDLADAMAATTTGWKTPRPGRRGSSLGSELKSWF